MLTRHKIAKERKLHVYFRQLSVKECVCRVFVIDVVEVQRGRHDENIADMSTIVSLFCKVRIGTEEL